MECERLCMYVSVCVYASMCVCVCVYAYLYVYLYLWKLFALKQLRICHWPSMVVFVCVLCVSVHEMHARSYFCLFV